jgi:uncharacterized membrane protein (DUF4010 family)
MIPVTGTFVFKLVLALLLGAFIGLEREMHERNETKSRRHQSFLGLRTFTLSTALGAITGLFYRTTPEFFILVTGAFFLFALSYYLLDSKFTRDIGITTEIALVYSFVIGVLISLDIVPLQLVIGITIILTLILSRKIEIQEFIRKIERAELGSFISFLVLALVILPMLPDTSYTLSDMPPLAQILGAFGINAAALAHTEIINPYKLWQIVALITGVDVFGYFLEKTIGQKGGWLVTSFAGGFISSTATTQSLAQQSNKTKSVDHLVSAAVVANLASFVQHSVIILPLSILLFTKALPVITLMILASTILTVYFLKQTRRNKNDTLQTTKKTLKQGKIFNLGPALKFALLFVVIKLVSQIALLFFGSNGFLVFIGLGAIPGIDAVLVSIAQLAGKTLSYQTALWAFIFANAVNLTTKSIYCFFQGKREFAVKFTVSAALILVFGIVGVLIRPA